MKKYATPLAPQNTSEFRVVDLTPCALPFMPVFAVTHRTHPFISTTRHRHEGFIEVMFCRQGDSMIFDCEGHDIKFRPGDVCVAQPETLHFLKSYPKGLKYYWFWLKLTDAKSQFPHLAPAESKNLLKRLRSLPVHFTGGDRINQAFRTVWKHYERAKDDPLRKFRLRLAVYDLLLCLTDVALKPADMTHAPKALDALMAEMREHPECTYPSEDLARRLNINVIQLNHRFKRATGLPSHAWLTSLRIARAKELLADPTLSVSTIAHRLGYHTSQYFATQFRNETGSSPRAWRKRNA